ncbi:MAG: PD-(D/E)XK nuclease family protein [Ruminococcus callidus]
MTQQKCYPSAVTAQMQRMFPGAETLRQSCSSLGTSYYSATLHAAYYQYVQNYAEQSADTASVGALLWDDPVYAQRLEGLTRFTVRHDENEPLFSIADTALVGHYLGDTMQLSASSLERYQKCPFRYYCNDILRLYQRQKVQMNAANYGSMVHYCLEQLLRKYDKKSFLALTAEQLQQEIQTSAAVYWQENMGGDFSKSEREQAAYHHAVEEVLPVCQHLQEEFRQSAFVPYCTELQISSENPNFPPICLHTEAGQTVKLIGKIDRVDICQDGDQQWVRVVDYKTNGKIFELGNLLYGLDMQMLIYLFSILSEERRCPMPSRLVYCIFRLAR